MAGFASTTDPAGKAAPFGETGPGLYACSAKGDPNSRVIVGKDGVVVVDAQATARGAMRPTSAVTNHEARQVAPSHHYTVRVLGASRYGAHAIIAPDATRPSIVERGR